MTKIGALDVNPQKIMSEMTLEVRMIGRKRFAIRTWLGAQILRLAAAVIGCKLAIELVEGDGSFDQRSLPVAFDGAPYREYVQIGPYSVPRACSVRSGPLYDAGFMEWGPHIEILVDGEVQRGVVSFDMDGGYVRRNKLNAEGNAYVAGDEVATEIVQGKVELRLRD